MGHLSSFVFNAIEVLVYLFIFITGMAFATIVVFYLIDRFQSKSTLRRNYPVLARFRYLFEHMGEFFRQFFFAQDREEMPFNRAERSWVYRAAKNVDSTVAFSSSRVLPALGTVFFVNCPLPTLDEDDEEPLDMTIGPYCKQPYTTKSIFNISRMSYGAIEFFDNLLEAIKERVIESAPDFITIDSVDGGTGAAPMSLIDNMGLPLKESLPLVIDKPIEHDLRERIKVCASGKLITPAEATWAFCAGAYFVNFARGFMFALGSIQSLQCNKNTCPTGITTHNKKLQYGLNPEEKAVRVMQYAKNMQKEICILAHVCGVLAPRQLKRKHARIVQANGKSVSMIVLHPEPVSKSTKEKALEDMIKLHSRMNIQA